MTYECALLADHKAVGVCATMAYTDADEVVGERRWITVLGVSGPVAEGRLGSYMSGLPRCVLVTEVLMEAGVPALLLCRFYSIACVVLIENRLLTVARRYINRRSKSAYGQPMGKFI